MAGRAAARWTLAGVLSLTALLYAPVLSSGYHYEDENWLPLVTEAPPVGVPGRGLALLTHHVTYRIAGFDPALYHLGNLSLHLLNALLVYGVAATLIPSGAAVWAAGVFLLHPLNSEAVSYISARTDLLMTTGVLLALWCSLGRLTWWRVAGMGLALLVAATSKEIGLIGIVLVTLTVAIWRPRTPMVVVTVVIAALAGGVAMGMAWPTLTNWFEMPARVGGPAAPWDLWLGLQLGMLWHLLTLVIWPVGFSIDHDALALSPRALLLAALLTFQAVALIGLCWRRLPVVAWTCAWVLLSVGPRFVFRTSEFVTEVQLYLPMVGISVLIGAAGHALWTWAPMTLSERTA